MKKVLNIWIALALTILVGLNLWNGIKPEVSDEELMNACIVEEFGEDCYGTMDSSRYHEYLGRIAFWVYDQNDVKIARVSLYKETALKQYCE